MSNFNEHSLEMAIMELFEQQGYSYVNGETIHKELSEMLLRDDLRMFLTDRYSKEGITPLEVERVIAKLTADNGAPFYVQNAQTYRLMTEGFAIKREDVSKPDLFVEVMDFDNVERNIFKVVNQLEIKGTQKRIPDGIVYVNGLPVVVLEFKSAVKTDATIMNAYTQLTVRYRRDIPELFRYNAFVVISDGVNNKYGALFADYDFFYAWRKIERTDKPGDGIDTLHTMMEGLFRKERLMSVIKDFVFFPDNSKSELKIVCRYPQFFATHRLYENILEHSHINIHGDGKGGTYFGATGCGKSLTMLFLTRMLMRSRHLASPTIVLITDRTDLDDQLSGQFLRTVINEFKKVNKMKGVDFTKRLNSLVEKYNDRSDNAIFAQEVLDEVAKQMAELLKEVNKEKKSFKDLGISYEEKAFYDILKEIAHKFGFEYPEDKLLALSADVKKMVDDKSKYTDWANRTDIKAELQMDLILILAEHGYPPVPQDDVFKEIFEQAENFKKYEKAESEEKVAEDTDWAIPFNMIDALAPSIENENSLSALEPLMECPDVDPDTGCRYTIKRYHSEKVGSDGSWEHSKVELKPLNPDYTVIELNDEDGYRTIGVFKGCVDAVSPYHRITVTFGNSKPNQFQGLNDEPLFFLLSRQIFCEIFVSLGEMRYLCRRKL